MWKLLSVFKRFTRESDWHWTKFYTDKYVIWVDTKEPLKRFVVSEPNHQAVASFGADGIPDWSDLDVFQLHEVLLLIHDLVG